MSRFAVLQPTSPLQGVAEQDVVAAEAAFGGRFPDGYSAFITKYGRGLLGGLVRIYTPREIAEGPRSFAEWRKRIGEYWFWEKTADLLSKEIALECVVIADTVGDDELIFHPSDPNRLCVLAHDFDGAYLASNTGLEAAIDWFFTSGKLDEPFEDNSFEPY